MLKPYAVKHNNEWYRILTHGFIHADTTHLFFNLFVLWQFGGAVENRLAAGQAEQGIALPGNYTFLMLYFGGLLIASIPAMYKHNDNPGYASLGASGAVSAVLMAYILCFPTAKLLLFFIVPMPAFLAGALFFAYESYITVQEALASHMMLISGAQPMESRLLLLQIRGPWKGCFQPFKWFSRNRITFNSRRLGSAEFGIGLRFLAS